MFFQNQKDCRSPLEVLNGHFDRCVGFSQSTLDTLAASLAGIFCTPTGDGAGHPLLWDTYKAYFPFILEFEEILESRASAENPRKRSRIF